LTFSGFSSAEIFSSEEGVALSLGSVFLFIDMVELDNKSEDVVDGLEEVTFEHFGS